MVAALDGVVHLETQHGRVAEHDGLGDVVLNAGAELVEERAGAAALFGLADHAEEHAGAAQIAGGLDLVDGDEAGLSHRDLTLDGFADGALEQLADTLDAEGGHGERPV